MRQDPAEEIPGRQAQRRVQEIAEIRRLRHLRLATLDCAR
jgi:hypothetical protein